MRALAALLFFLFPSGGEAGDAAPLRVTLEPAFKKLSFKKPLYLVSAPGSTRLFVVEQGGVIWVMPGRGAAKRKLFLDLSAKTRASGERGLLGLAFHPRYAENGRFFVYYSDLSAKERGRDHQSVVARFTASEDADRADPDSETEILRVDQPYSNHNGGCLQFAADGYLYIGLGDGGSAGDPQGHAQNLGSLLGKILRIDVDRPADELPYGIPKDNPFRGRRGARPEIWAYGLRNPWRFSFDRETGELWAGDVGQNEVEEIDRILPGGNYGWNYFEGSRAYRSGAGVDAASFEKPVLDYLQQVGGRSVTGGYVYRGDALPELFGLYIYGDYTSGRIRGFRYEGGEAVGDQLLAATGKAISSFGEDARGELYATAFDGGVYRLTLRR